MEQGRRLFELCRLYIDGGLNPEEKDSLTKEIEDAFDNWQFDNRALFDEITANLEEPMSEQQRERYCFSLITPFGEYSKTLHPKWIIGKSQESINYRQRIGGDVSYLERQIEKSNRRADKYKDLAFSIGKQEGNEDESVFFEFAQIVCVEYANILDAAFVMFGLDLKQLQDKCCVWIKQDWQHELRVLDVGHYVGSEALAEEYLSRLPQEQPEPQQEQKAAAQDYNIEPQQGEQTTVVLPDVLNTQKTRAVFDEAISRGWMKENGKGDYEWLGLKDWKRGRQQQFVYMVGQMYGYKKSDSGNEGNSIPCKPLEKLFGISGIYSLLIKCWEASKPQPWRQAIDDMITAALLKIIVSTPN